VWSNEHKKEVFYMNEPYNSTQSITEVILEERENFKKRFGRLLTVEEAIKLTDEIREAIKNEEKERK